MAGHSPGSEQEKKGHKKRLLRLYSYFLLLVSLFSFPFLKKKGKKKIVFLLLTVEEKKILKAKLIVTMEQSTRPTSRQGTQKFFFICGTLASAYKKKMERTAQAKRRGLRTHPSSLLYLFFHFFFMCRDRDAAALLFFFFNKKNYLRHAC